jgi:microcompartment protein CcmK/EutM
MRVARVIGKVVLNRKLQEIVPGTFLLVRTCNRGTLAGKNAGNDEVLVAYDNLAAREGDLIGLVEGREGAVAFHPARVPFDAYNACILDRVEFAPILKT